MSPASLEEGKDSASRIFDYIRKIQDNLTGIEQNRNKKVTGDTQQKQKQVKDLSLPCEVAMKQHHADLGVDSDLSSKQQQQHNNFAMDADVVPLPGQLAPTI
jgi:hypothetical protein